MLQTDGLLLSVCALPPCVNFGGSLLDGHAWAVIVTDFPSATCDDHSESLSILRTDRSRWATLYFPGTAVTSTTAHAVISRACRWFTISYWRFNEHRLTRE